MSRPIISGGSTHSWAWHGGCLQGALALWRTEQICAKVGDCIAAVYVRHAGQLGERTHVHAVCFERRKRALGMPARRRFPLCAYRTEPASARAQVQATGESQRAVSIGNALSKRIVRRSRCHHPVEIEAVEQCADRLIDDGVCILMRAGDERVDIANVRRTHPAFPKIAAGVAFA